MTTPSADSFDGRVPSGDDSPIDVSPPAAPPQSREGWRRLLEWTATSAPVGLLLASGIACGPNGLNLLSVDTLSVLGPVTSVALAALGVLVGLSVGAGRSEGSVFAGATIEAGLTFLIVSLGVGGLALAGAPGFAHPDAIVIAGAGICAASSLTLPTGNPLEPRSMATRLVEVGVLVPILLGGLMLAWVRGGSPVGAVILIGAASALICAVATAAWLLLTVATSDTEKGVVTIAALLLMGGVSDALAMSALFVGVGAGFFWRVVAGRPLEAIGRDVLFIQHPLLVVVLLAAGAGATFATETLTLAALYLVLRLIGRLAGGSLATRLSGTALPTDLGRHLLPPGVFGVAFALNAAGVAGVDATLLLGIVVLGTIGSELAAFRLSPRRIDA